MHTRTGNMLVDEFKQTEFLMIVKNDEKNTEPEDTPDKNAS